MYTSASGALGGGGGGGDGTELRVGGAGADLGGATGVGLTVANCADFPSSGWTAGFGLEVFPLSEGPPARRSFPWVIGLTIPGFLFAAGREVLDGGSPDGTRTVWLL